ncbi:MAG: hypothetical protein DMF60_17255, partial [Acidobacteria bacterium]
MKRVTGKTFILFNALLLSTPMVYSQAPPQSRADQSIKLSTELVVFDAQAVNKKTGRNVGGLSAAEFKVSEDGLQQQITHFSQDSLPLS